MLRRIVSASLSAMLLACTPIFPQGRLGEAPQTVRLSSAQGTAMGLTGAAYSEGLFSVAANPAGLAFLKKLELGFSHYPGVSSSDDEEYFNQETFAVALRVHNNTVVSFNCLHFDYGNEGSGLRIPGVSASHLITWGQNLFSLGMTAKYFDERIDDFKANVFWFDVGARYKLLGANRESLSLGLSLSNVGKDLKDESGFVFATPLKLLRAGMAYQTRRIGDSILNMLATIEYQRSLRKEETSRYSQYYRWHHLGTGLEARFSDYLFGRIGYNFDLADVENKTRGLTYGLGFTTPEKFSKSIPIFVSLSYGRSLMRLRDYDQNAFNVEIGFEP